MLTPNVETHCFSFTPSLPHLIIPVCLEEGVPFLGCFLYTWMPSPKSFTCHDGKKSGFLYSQILQFFGSTKSGFSFLGCLHPKRSAEIRMVPGRISYLPKTFTAGEPRRHNRRVRP
ncbi:unnamed protein product [Ectocarpus sp. 8 AP-2014]